jgi:hypothetical protein
VVATCHNKGNFEMKVVKATGLVPLLLIKASLPHNAGEITGVSPDKVVAAITSGEATLVDIPSDVETIDVAVPGEEVLAPAPEAEKPSKPSKIKDPA